MGKRPQPTWGSRSPATHSISLCPFTPGLLSLHTNNHKECCAFGSQPILQPGTNQFRYSQKGVVSFLPLLFTCWSAWTKELASLLLSYLRTYLRPSKGAFIPFFVPCFLLSKMKGDRVSFSSLGTATEVSRTHAVLGQTLQPGRSSVIPWKKHMKGAWFGPKHTESKASERLSPLWFCGKLRKPFTSGAEGSLWGFLASCRLFLLRSQLRGACWFWG